MRGLLLSQVWWGIAEVGRQHGMAEEEIEKAKILFDEMYVSDELPEDLGVK